MTGFGDAAVDACQRLLGVRVTRTDHPGGKSRKSIRAHLEDRTVIVTRRRNARRAELEAEVLRELRARGAAVPRVIAFDGAWLIQEDLRGPRLSQLVAKSGPAECEKWLDAALASLAGIHRAGREARLHRRVAVIGAKPDWLPKLLATPERLGGHFGLPAPALPREALAERLRNGTPRFIKWDARPGNAIVLETGAVAWFDWEHCGCRNALDDVAWLLGDEYVPDRPDAENRLLERHLPALAGDGDPRDAREYLAAFGVFHMCMRLGLIVSHKGRGPWWDWRYCLSGDKVGVTAETARATCLRGARWAAESPLTEALAPWFGELARRIAEEGFEPTRTLA